MIENHMVVGDYYPEPEPREVDEDEAFERWRDDNDSDCTEERSAA